MSTQGAARTPRLLHFIGIGGIGQSAIARVMHERGLCIRGSDVRESQITIALRELGIDVRIGHAARHVEGVDAVVVSSAIPETNPELVEARRLGIAVLHRSLALAAVMDRPHTVGVIGTHGKGTVSSAIAWLLDAGFGGNDAGGTHAVGFVIGGLLENYRHNARDGRQWLVAEVDESDGTLVEVKPHVALLNNLELDHLHYYPSWDKLERRVIEYFHDNETLEAAFFNVDDAGVRRVLAKLAPRVNKVTFGFETPDVDVRGSALETRRMAGAFDVSVRDGATWRRLGRVEIALPGAYNASNALGAIAVALHAGVPFNTIVAALPRFRGLENRFTLVDADGVEVVKDYISHPTGIRRVLEAARGQAEGPLVGVFKPYRFTMIHYLQDDYRDAFKDADEVVITEMYTAGEVPIPGIDTEFLCNKIRETGARVHYVQDIDAIPAWLQANVEAPAHVLFFGGDDLFAVADRYVAARRANAGGAR